MSPVIFFLFASLCAVVGARSFITPEDQCSKSAVSACMGNVHKRTSDIGFCEQAAAALDCFSDVLRMCYTRNDPGFLEALGMYDITGLFRKMTAICS